MQPLLALLDTVLANLTDDATVARIMDRAAERRKDLGSAAGTVERAESVLMAFSDVTRVSPADAYRIIANRAVGPLSERMAKTLQKHSTAHTLCLHLNAVIDDDLQPLVPTLSLPVVDVEMVDASALRVSLVASPEIVALAQGLLSGFARHYGQLARFAEVPLPRGHVSAPLSGRRQFDVLFQRDERAIPDRRDDRTPSAVTVALQSLFR